MKEKMRKNLFRAIRCYIQEETTAIDETQMEPQPRMATAPKDKVKHPSQIGSRVRERNRR